MMTVIEDHEQLIIAAWRNRPFKSAPPAPDEIGRALAIREQFRRLSFDLRRVGRVRPYCGS
jgi:hypothetical protein